MSRPVNHELNRRIWGLLAKGRRKAVVAREVGVAASWVATLNARVGGVYRPEDVTYDARYLSRDERYELARLLDVRPVLSHAEIARRMGRSPSTICRELARNRDPRTGRYVPEKAVTVAWQRQRRPKPSRLASHEQLRQEVQDRLSRGHSPEQIAGRLRVDFPDNASMQVSHETIYLSLYVYPRGALKRELQAHLRTGRVLRQPAGHRDEKRGRIVDAVSIHDRPDEVEGRLIPGHHEGDLIMGTVASNSAIGTIVERTTGFLTLCHLPHGHKADHVARAVVDAFTPLPAMFAKSLTWDRGTEMHHHATVTAATGIKVYFADPHSPWQRGSNENTNGLLRQYFPKGTDLSVHSRADLQHVQDLLNDRPRKRLGYRTPREEMVRLLQ